MDEFVARGVGLLVGIHFLLGESEVFVVTFAESERESMKTMRGWHTVGIGAPIALLFCESCVRILAFIGFERVSGVRGVVRKRGWHTQLGVVDERTASSMYRVGGAIPNDVSHCRVIVGSRVGITYSRTMEGDPCWSAMVGKMGYSLVLGVDEFVV